MFEPGLNLRLERTEAYIAISNVMGKYVFHRMNEELGKVVGLFSKASDLQIEMPSGIYTGSDAAHRCFELDHAVEEKEDPSLVIHNISTPVIEVASDCRTARGVWISPGIATASMPGGKKGLWAWVKYDCDFILEDGQWKIWHMRKHEIFTAATDRSWTDEDTMGMGGPVGGSGGPGKPEGPGSPPPRRMKSNDLPAAPSTKFNLKKKAPAIPVPPEPYKTWNE